MTLLWKRSQIHLIRAGKKTATRRIRRPNLRTGGVYRLRLDFFHYLDEKIQVERMYEQALGDLSEEDARREGCLGVGEFRSLWGGIYGEWIAESRVWVVEFRLAGDRNI